MVIFIDTSALFVLAARDDVDHDRALAILDHALAEGHTFLLHNLVLVECVSLLHRRKNYETACLLIREIDRFKMFMVDERLHKEALGKFLSSTNRRLSLVDQVSFAVMRKEGIKYAFAFDQDFARAGFQIYTGR
jgi:predicted nucleic acid-binding protein